jgi:hypothetical protein
VPFRVLLDEDGEAAGIVQLNSIGLRNLADPKALLAPIRSWSVGHRQHKTGRRPMQLGGTLVMGPADDVIFLDLETYAGDHADLDDVLAAIENH